MPDFKLWLEFEHFDLSEWNAQNEFCNIQVELSNGKNYGINVWTFTYLKTAVSHDTDANKNLNGAYIIPPDLFVKELTRECIEATITDLLSVGPLEQMLNPSVLIKKAD